MFQATIETPQQELPELTAKQAAIVEAAQKLFLSNGYTDTSMDAIAEEANVSKQTIYSNFQNKETLFRGMMTMMCSTFPCPCSGMDEAEAANTPPEQILSQAAERLLQIILTEPGISLYRLVMSESSRSPELARIFYEMGPKRTTARLTEYFTNLHNAGILHVPEPEAAANTFISLVRGELHAQALMGMPPKPESPEVQQHVEQAVRFFLRGHAPQAN